ncbi:uncharacterized protein RHO25_012706 [Cercospora beticola]|uniref:Uncharacterized protein n=1 Tax=Cercospora beticola TaxID=122368 RepID=A0ABZ0P8S3_CERBT|nr:hypothetical protein RHO25_012706 [Cercospora beticola]CAK1368099.1 unnamed protein product [Cercospora beticola]
MQFTTILASALAVTVAAALPQTTQENTENSPVSYGSGSDSDSSATSPSTGSGSGSYSPSPYGGDNTTSPSPIYPITNGTSPSGGALPTGTGSASSPTGSAGFVASTGGASRSFGSSAAMGLVFVGGVALAL